MRTTIKIFVLFLIVGLIAPWGVQADWKPKDTIKVYVGVSAGGGVDTVARVFTNAMAENTGWNFTVINVTGGGGSVMLKTLKKQKPDGHAIAFHPSEVFTFNPTINPKIGFDYTDFTYIAAVSESQAGLISMADKPWNSFEEVIAAAKAGQEVSVAYQAPKMGLCMKAIEKVMGVKFTLVPVKGGSAGMKNLLGKHVDLAWGAGIQAKYVKAGQMKVMASCEKDRLGMAPDVPTMKELGVKQVVLGALFQFAGPKGMPKEVVDALAKEIKKASESKKINDLIANKLSLKAIFIAGADLENIIAESKKEAEELVSFVKQ